MARLMNRARGKRRVTQKQALSLEIRHVMAKMEKEKCQTSSEERVRTANDRSLEDADEEIGMDVE